MSDDADDFDWMASIPQTHDDQEIWACEGAIRELTYYRDEEAKDAEDRAKTHAIIRRLNARRNRLIEEVRC